MSSDHESVTSHWHGDGPSHGHGRRGPTAGTGLRLGVTATVPRD